MQNKRFLPAFAFLLLAAAALAAAPVDDLIKQAQDEYGRGNLTEAVRLLGSAYSTNPSAAAQKSALANAYTDIGVKEYDRRNFKNAFECFKNAVKLAPTNTTASNYFWKMRNAGSTDTLKNEAGDVVRAAAPGTPAGNATGSGTATASGTGPGPAVAAAAGSTAADAGSSAASGTASAPGVDPALYKETLERLARTEQELAGLRSTSGRTKEESEALKAELEAQRKKAEQDLAGIEKAAAAAAAESAAVKAELERQRQASAREVESLQKAAAAAAQENSAVRAELEKQRQASARDLENIERAAAMAAAESAAVKADLERQRQASTRDLEAIQKAAAAAAAESAAVKADLERQKTLTDKQREELQKAALSAKDDSQAVRSELGQYKVLVDQLKERMAASDRSASNDTKALSELVAAYQKSLETQGTASQESARRLSEELAEQKRRLEEQENAARLRNIVLFGSLGLLVLLLGGLLLLVLRARARRRGTRTTAMGAGYAALGLGPEPAPQGLGRLPGREALLLEALPADAQGGGGSGGPAVSAEMGMYRDLLKAERLKRMHDEMKAGALKWETVREYIGELDKDLRVDVLKTVEAKISEGEGADPRSVMAVVFPFLTEHDDYLREKAESLVKASLRSPAASGEPRYLAALPAPVSPAGEADSVLGMPSLLAITEQLRKVLKERDRSEATAKLARSMGRKLGFSNADADLLYKSALAHDVGYLLLDRDALQRILGKTVLSEEDFQFIRSHAKKGLEYFKGKKVPQELKDSILYHHEYNDGSGYPKGLMGPKIPPFPKIIAVAETFVALTSERPYREKLAPEAALAVVRDGAGRKFDREHIDALTELVRRNGNGEAT